MAAHRRGMAGKMEPHMICSTRSPVRAVLVALLAVSMSIPVCAQGQSPTTSRQIPQRRQPTKPPSQRLPQQQQQQQQQRTTSPTSRANTGLSSSSRRTGTTSSRQPGASSRGATGGLGRGAATGQGSSLGRGTSRATGRQQTGQQQRGTSRQGAGPETGQGQAPTRRAGGGSRGAASANIQTVTGGGGGGAGATVTRGMPAAATVQGQGTYEPAFDHELEYGPLPEGGENVEFLEGPMGLQEFMQTINIATNWSIIVTEPAQALQLPYFVITQKTAAQAMEILKAHDVYYEYKEESDFLFVMLKEEYLEDEYADVEFHEFRVEEVEVQYIESFLSSLLSKKGRLITDQRTSRIYVWDTQDNLDQMIKTVEDLDVPLQKQEFRVHHADLGDIESVLNSLITPNGSMLADPRTAQIFVWDQPTALEQMQLAVTRLDVPVMSKEYHIEHISAEDLVDSLEVLMSERGRIQVDPRYNSIIITDLPTRIEKMEEIINSLDKDIETRTWVIEYADIDFIADQIEMYIPDEMGEIVVNDLTHQVTVTGLPERLEKIAKLIEVWDIKRRQVLIEAFIVEISRSVERQFNINWSFFDSTGNAPIAIHSGAGASGPVEAGDSGQSASMGQAPYAVPAYGRLQVDDSGNITRPILTNIDGETVIDKFAGNRIAATLNYLDRTNKATILSSPRVTVQDGEEAMFENATKVPYVSATTFYNNYSTNISRVNNTNRVEFIDVGTILSVYPRITESEDILLDISAEDSTFVDKEIVANNQKSTVPEKTVRRAETQLRVASGETVVLGGLRRDRTSHAKTKTPFLGDLPVIGRLFNNPQRSSENSTLMIFITTTIVGEDTHPEAVALAAAEEGLADAMRYNMKDFWGRLSDRMSRGENEINVSVGQSGSIHSEGDHVEIEELRDALFKAAEAGNPMVVVRQHPRAPQSVVTEVTEAVLEADLDIEFDNDLVPLVPKYETGPGPTEAAALSALEKDQTELMHQLEEAEVGEDTTEEPPEEQVEQEKEAKPAAETPAEEPAKETQESGGDVVVQDAEPAEPVKEQSEEGDNTE